MCGHVLAGTKKKHDLDLEHRPNLPQKCWVKSCRSIYVMLAQAPAASPYYVTSIALARDATTHFIGFLSATLTND
ncbi:unnamed protein product [Danaus chrysippus]|uniref:(African queen) hypothetical protein n=1 Tax=Danaus chrysippus TaxID=151541 RepID=A0A8J2W4F1_9NEOP|nr:unnamed protein product [Danaus chrysippus]